MGYNFHNILSFYKKLFNTRNANIKWDKIKTIYNIENYRTVLYLTKRKKIYIDFFYYFKIDYYMVSFFLETNKIDINKRSNFLNIRSNNNSLKDDIILLYDSIKFQLKFLDY